MKFFTVYVLQWYCRQKTVLQSNYFYVIGTYALTLQAPTPQNGQTHSNNSSAAANFGLFCIILAINFWTLYNENVNKFLYSFVQNNTTFDQLFEKLRLRITKPCDNFFILKIAFFKSFTTKKTFVMVSDTYKLN